MGKKKHPANRHKSKRGHREALVTRYREVKKRIPVDKDGNPLDTPKLPSERRALAKAMLEHTGGITTLEKAVKPDPDLVMAPPKSNNVLSFFGKKANKPANSDEFHKDAQEFIARERAVYKKWGERESLYISDKEREASDFRRLLEYVAAHPKGKNESPNIGTSKQPISMVHNPGISPNPIKPETEHGGYTDKVVSYHKRSRPIVVHNRMNREGQYKLYDPRIHAPSGLPISEFVTGKYKPVIKQQSTEVKHSAKATKRAWSAEEQLFTMLDMVPEEHWPMDHLKPFLFKDNKTGKWHVHTGQVRRAINKQEDRIINRAVTLAFIQHAQDTDEYIGVLEGENKFLHQENKLISFENAHYHQDEETKLELQRELYDWTPKGARVSARGIRSEDASKYATVYPKPPENVDKLVAEFKMFNSFLAYNGANEAFARMKYGDPAVAKRVEDECQRRIQERAEQARPKLEMLRLRSTFRQIPLLITLTKERDFMQRLSAKHSLVSREVYALKRMHKRNHKPRLVKSAHLSGLNIQITRFNTKTSVWMNGKRVTTDVREVHRTVPRVQVKQPTVNYRRYVDQLHSIRPISLYVQVQPTLNIGQPIVPVAHEQRIKRWEEWIDGCLSRDYQRQEEALEAVSYAKAQAEVELHREYLKKPINKAVGKVSGFFKKLKQVGDKDVIVTPWERRKREENTRILRERTENEIREQQKLEEKERREEAEREARRKARRDEKARRKAKERADQARNQEQKAIKQAAKKAFSIAH